ncbi:type II/IV secretion system ATPase subunit [Candidatus Woesearchaeota archaeon]|jgi:archaeal flagellar protein FlaI|nr:type II/IV secretion system ATPase subunit [Candidatus Woesearchaeota archaeon]MBT4387262.1 type II/IV secretion system ATPase subunit [Candidatus Woesearchaeota archaeon]MBT4596263.1 type II/IV secretion system ATPase subunit [Candidatus Woesearchaeota archaeon]MBT5741514.1 type II/IV secretion system ATPase subunit [Candidatus Woesearchaeota archaeon]MBT6505486.1 type II/IV secretion system ATPase subunit [Candidatus Woesearchaeota archaeon]
MADFNFDINKASNKIQKVNNYPFEIIREGEEVIVRIDYEKAPFTPSIEDSSDCMANVIEILAGVKNATKILFFQKRDYEYDYQTVHYLTQVASVHNNIQKNKELFSYNNLGQKKEASDFYNQWFYNIQKIINSKIKSDPVGAYVELIRLLRQEETIYVNRIGIRNTIFNQNYKYLLNYIKKELEKTDLIQSCQKKLAGYDPKSRTFYREIFKPTIKPDFMFSKLMGNYPKDGIEVENYIIDKNIDVSIFQFEDSIKYLYHITPPEFKLDEDKYDLLDVARKIMAEHKPTKDDFVQPERLREVFSNIGMDLIEELAKYKKIKLKEGETKLLSEILIRYSVGFGLLEVLLKDPNIQDIAVNSPLGNLPIFLVHSKFDECETNIIPMKNEADNWASKLRMISGRPLDESNPILDTELELPGVSTRVSVISQPIDPTGLAFSLRKHRPKPWTLPLFVENGMLTSLAAGFLSFCIDGTRSMFICGTRGSGKTSLLNSIITEMTRRNRIITIEDTLELPFTSYRKLGYNIVQMKVSSALSQNKGGEFTATEGIRSTLRLGDSSLIVGEVRSKEAVALFEAMRVGAGANVTAGTFHADNPFGVFDRVVNALKIPPSSFKALDLIVIANPIKSADGMKKVRRVTQITEVRKDWYSDPLKEGGFVDLFKYDSKLDKLIPTDDLLNGNSEILKTIASKISDFVGNWDLMWENIQLRSKTKETLVNYSKKINDKSILEADFVIESNDKLHKVIQEVKLKKGIIDSELVFVTWENWLRKKIRLKYIK